MTPRLVRALQRGGVTAEIGSDVWGIWRSPDRRRRIIGKVPGRHIDLMKLDEFLIPVASVGPHVWTWSDKAAEFDAIAVTAGGERPFLHDLILTCPSPSSRHNYSRAARLFCRDLDVAGQHVEFASRDEQRARAEACIRLAHVRDQMSDSDHAFLLMFVRSRASRLGLANAYGLRSDAIETLALSGLRALINLYCVPARSRMPAGSRFP